MENKFVKIIDTLKSKIYFNYNVGKFTWFRTGGNAKIFVLVENSEELEIILNEIDNDNYYIMGSGSNLLIRDNGFNGTIIKLGKGFNSLNIVEDKLEVGASVQDVILSNFALRNSIKGFEFFSGIPGSIGGAVKMNAGCFGSDTKRNIDSIEIYNNNFQKQVMTKEEIKLSYRSSNIKNHQIITKAIFKIDYGNVDDIKQGMLTIKKQRLLSQPIKNRTSGSTFKNPPNLYAAKLIEDAGCKGMKLGNAYVSEKHSNFLMNNGKASSYDLENLGNLIIEKVYKKFGIKLDWEVKIIGDK